MTPENEKALRAASTLISEAIPSDQLCNSIAAHIRRLVAEVERSKTPLTDEQKIAEALRQYGITVVKTETGYKVMSLGQITAHGIGAKT